MKTHKLSTNKEVKLKEMSVDDMDYCNDLPQMRYENDQIVAITNLAKARTAWIRKGVEGADDAFIKSLTDEEKNELSLAIQEYQRLGE
jgi:hypothetical protein|tara:strand:- start:19116 stop:19379 length:264 start_codon:yes stop_codon:yes gene_type:complete